MNGYNNITPIEAAKVVADMCALRDTCFDCCFYMPRGCMFTTTDGYDSGRNPTEWEFPNED